MIISERTWRFREVADAGHLAMVPGSRKGLLDVIGDDVDDDDDVVEEEKVAWTFPPGP